MPKTAYNSIDHTRCVLMVLVIMVHTVKFGELYPAVKDFINFFFMPAFLLLTGYLVNVEKSPRDFGRYLWKIILPYTVMVTGFACLSTLLPVRDGIGSLTPAALARALLVTGIGPYWFLHTMVVCGALYWLAFRLPVRRWAAAVRLGAFGLLLLATVRLTPLLGGTYALFYFIGAALRASGADLRRVLPPSPWALVPFAVLAAADYERFGVFSVAVLALSFLSFVPWLVEHGLRGRALRWVGFVGRNTFPVYIFHPVFTMLCKFILPPLLAFDASGLLHTAATVTLCLAGSLALALGLDRAGLSPLLGRRRLLR